MKRPLNYCVIGILCGATLFSFSQVGQLLAQPVTSVENPLPLGERIFTEGDSVVVPITATDLDNDVLTFRKVSGPDFVVLDQIISCVHDDPNKSICTTILRIDPLFNHSGNYSIILEVSDDQGGSGFGEILLSIQEGNQSPLFEKLQSQE